MAPQIRPDGARLYLRMSGSDLGILVVIPVAWPVLGATRRFPGHRNLPIVEASAWGEAGQFGGRAERREGERSCAASQLGSAKLTMRSNKRL
jgi:hypothetical protein